MKSEKMNTETERINLDDYVQTGEGGTALTYTHKNGERLAKLYNAGFEADRAQAEFLTACTVFELGIPTPKPYRMVTDGERTGAEYELIRHKRSFTRIVSEQPERLEQLSVKFARLAKELHATPADTSRLRSYKQGIERFYREKRLVPEEYKRKALAFLEHVPDTPNCVHGDLHFGNIITDGERDLWIDVGEFAYGAPEWDLGIMWRMTHGMDEERANRLFHVTPETLTAHWDFFFPAYMGTDDPQVLGEATKRMIPFAAAKIPYVFDMAFHGPLPDEAFPRLIQAFG